MSNFINTLIFQWITITNFFFSIYILTLTLFFGEPSIVGEGFLTLAFVSLFTSGLSSNLRNIFIANSKSITLKEVLSFRLTIGLCGAVITYLVILFFIKSENVNFLFSVSLLVIFGWIFEMIIADNELKKKYNKKHFLNSIVLFLGSPILIYLNYLNQLIILILIFSLLNIFIFRNFLFLPLKEIIMHFNLKVFKFKLGLSSTLLKSFSNLIWRYSAFILIGSYKSGILFTAFAIGSFFGTLFDVSYGAFFVKNRKIIKNLDFYFYFLICTYVLSAVIILYFFNKYGDLNQFDKTFFNYATIISIVGSFFTVKALKIRQNYFSEIINHKRCFKLDICSYTFNSLLIPILFLMEEEFLIYAYFFSSLFHYLIYRLFVDDKFKKNK